MIISVPIFGASVSLYNARFRVSRGTVHGSGEKRVAILVD